MEKKTELIKKCRLLLEAYRAGKLGYMAMPEDSSPQFAETDAEIRLVYFTLPMSLNYRRDSYKLWEAALSTFNDPKTKIVFSIKSSASLEEKTLRRHLMQYKVALQPNKHIATWQTIAKTISANWGTITNLLAAADYDYLKLRDIVQSQYKRGFPYLSGPKIFNYWCFIIQEYSKVRLKNAEFIEIAPDTHITQSSVLLGVISKEESDTLTKEKISERWRELLRGSGINPIDMHPPLWFWSRNNFQYTLP